MIQELIQEHFQDDRVKATELSKAILELCIKSINKYADDNFVMYRDTTSLNYGNIYILGNSDGADDCSRIIEKYLDELL